MPVAVRRRCRFRVSAISWSGNASAILRIIASTVKVDRPRHPTLFFVQRTWLCRSPAQCNTSVTSRLAGSTSATISRSTKRTMRCLRRISEQACQTAGKSCAKLSNDARLGIAVAAKRRSNSAHCAAAARTFSSARFQRASNSPATKR